MSVDNELAICDFSSIDELRNDHVGGEYEDGDEPDLEPVLSFTRVHAAYETAGSFFYTCSISECDELCIGTISAETKCLN